MDALLVPTEVVAHEVYAQISTPMLWRFIQEMPAQGDEWAADLDPAAAVQLRPRAPRPVEDQAGPRAGPGPGRLARRTAGSSSATCCAARRTGSGGSRWCRCCCSATARPSSPPTARRCWRRDDRAVVRRAGLRAARAGEHPGGRLDRRVRAVRPAHSVELGLAQAVPQGPHGNHGRRPRRHDQPPGVAVTTTGGAADPERSGVDGGPDQLAPICCIISRPLASPHRSTTCPCSILTMSIPVSRTVR